MDLFKEPTEEEPFEKNTNKRLGHQEETSDSNDSDDEDNSE
jgi:hypothetical protein